MVILADSALFIPTTTIQSAHSINSIFYIHCSAFSQGFRLSGTVNSLCTAQRCLPKWRRGFEFSPHAMHLMICVDMRLYRPAESGERSPLIILPIAKWAYQDHCLSNSLLNASSSLTALSPHPNSTPSVLIQSVRDSNSVGLEVKPRKLYFGYMLSDSDADG